MTTQQAINAIVTMDTLPPQIDFISVKKMREYNNATRFINSLPSDEKKKANASITAQIDEYIKPMECSDGIWRSPADLDAMF